MVVVSLFVNPAQFNERADLERYPRDEQRDAGLAAEAGADLLFAPSAEEVYPQGFATAVEVLGVTDRLEGAARGAAHFRGVTHGRDEAAVHGAARTCCTSARRTRSRCVVIRRLVADLNLPVAIEALPTVREPDGLAMSSRNALLSPAERAARARAARGAAAPPQRAARRAASARRERCWRRRAASWSASGSSPSTWRSSTPRRSSRSRGSTGRRCWRSRRASARCA